MPRPRGNDWLEDELSDLRYLGIDVLVSLLEDFETAELDLRQESELAGRVGLEFISFPIPDRTPPPLNPTFHELIRRLTRALNGGRSVAVHCRQGIGRASCVVGAVLVSLGATPDDAWALIEAGRGRPVPDTNEQRRWLTAFSELVE